MNDPYINITENVKHVLDEISAAADLCGRDPSEITLVAASKMNPAETVRLSAAAGISVFGENRVQEMLEKNALGAYAGCDLHFIGHLQKNKVKNVVGLASLIHGIDSLSLLETVSRIAESKNMIQDVLLEINIGAEETKSGFSPSEISDILDSAQALKGIKVRGLMAIPPICEKPEENHPFFARMQQLFIDIGAKKYDNSSMDFLSMGMSRDYTEAIKCGSNMVRVGTAIFGPRNYSK
ncbi:MAG: YggS family pyridoxal phosphate-dependent enzyme [Eubacteriales bacterium]|nr:YggS family pyridoxal phosphate-dependent enzyme [Eubacteriales bacterium]